MINSGPLDTQRTDELQIARLMKETGPTADHTVHRVSADPEDCPQR